VSIAPPVEAVPFPLLVADAPPGAAADALMPWLGEHLEEGTDLAELRLFALAVGEGDGAILLLKAPVDDRIGSEELAPLRHCWRAALAAGIEQDRSAHLAEQLAEANRTVLDMQETLSQSRTLATLGEVAAGAAHEMNNPLTVISGRSQLLANRVDDPELRAMALDVAGQSHRLSDMITALRAFAEPVVPEIRPVDLPELILRAVQQTETQNRRQPQVDTVFTNPLPPVCVDGDLMGAAVSELVRNAMEAKGSNHIELRVQTDPLDDRLRIEVRDDGSGLTEHTLRHAFDPFFSDKPAGRQPGLGLARARRYVEAHGGQITLANSPAGGALATIWLSRWSGEDQGQAA
jgi:signal transduction histidine kinase